MADDRDFERRLREAMHREADGLPLRLDAATVHQAMNGRSRLPSWLVPVLLPVGAAIVAGAVLLNAFPGPVDGPGAAVPTERANVTPLPTASAAATPASTPHPAFGQRRAAAQRDGRFYVIGGQGSPQVSRSVAMFDGVNWNDLPGLPEGRAGAGAAVLPDGRLAVFGGEVDQQLTDSTLVLEPGASAWIAGDPMPYAQADMAVAELHGRVYLFGGSAAGHGADILVFEPDGSAWSTVPMPYELDDLRVATLNGAMYVVGAPRAESDGTPPTLAFRVDPAAAAWTQLASVPIKPLATVAAGGRVWAIGRPGPDHTGGVAFYEPEGDSWTLTDEQLPPGAATLVIPGSRSLIVIGAFRDGLTTTVIDLETP